MALTGIFTALIVSVAAMFDFLGVLPIRHNLPDAITKLAWVQWYTREADLSEMNEEHRILARQSHAERSIGEERRRLKVMEAELKDDPRTAVLRAALSLGDSPVSGATELEKLLFNTRYPPEK